MLTLGILEKNREKSQHGCVSLQLIQSHLINAGALKEVSYTISLYISFFFEQDGGHVSNFNDDCLFYPEVHGVIDTIEGRPCSNIFVTENNDGVGD